MATVTMDVTKIMKDKMLNNWRAKTNYGVILTTISGQHTPQVRGEALTFGGPTATTGGSKITHEGPTDLTVYSNETVAEFRITRDNTNPNTIPHASGNITDATYEYGGVFRINKIEITLT